MKLEYISEYSKRGLTVFEGLWSGLLVLLAGSESGVSWDGACAIAVAERAFFKALLVFVRFRAAGPTRFFWRPRLFVLAPESSLD